MSLVRGLAYGQISDYVETPVIGLTTTVWFIPPGRDPEDFAISIGDFIHLTIKERGATPHTGFMFHVPEVGDSGDAIRVGCRSVPDPTSRLRLPFLQHRGAAGDSSDHRLRPAGACIARATQDNYQPVAAGSYAFALYAGAGASNCQGTVIATAPATTFGDGEVWMLYGFGDAANGYELRPVKLRRN